MRKLFKLTIPGVGTATLDNVGDLAESVVAHFDNYEDSISIEVVEDCDETKKYPLLDFKG